MENQPQRKRSMSGEEELTMEDITVMKLMEEIIEYDQEVKMKQNWINTRMKMLHQIQRKKDDSNETKMLIDNFM